MSREPGNLRSEPRLAYVCHVFPHLTQTFVYREVEELRRAGIRLTVFSMKRPDPATLSEECRHLMADTVYLPPVTSVAMLGSQLTWLLRAPRRYARAAWLAARGRYRYDNGPLLWLRGMVEFTRGAHLARLLTRQALDVRREALVSEPVTPHAQRLTPVFCHLHAQFADGACTSAMTASLLTGIPFSFRSHTSPNPQLIGEKVARAQFVVSASVYDRRVLVQWCGEPAAGKIYVNRLGVPLDRYEPGIRYSEFGVRGSVFGPEQSEPRTPNTEPRTPNTEPLILSVGTLCAKKGFEYLIRACRVLADQGLPFRCMIVGDGPDWDRLAELVSYLGIGDRMCLTPYRPQEALRELYREAAVFALPCIFPLDGNVDVIPLVLQEAMAIGLPVVSTPISGIPELIQDGVNGLLAPEKDHEALAEALAAILSDGELATRLGEAGQETIQHGFDLAVNAGELARLFGCEVPELQGDDDLMT